MSESQTEVSGPEESPWTGRAVGSWGWAEGSRPGRPRMRLRTAVWPCWSSAPSTRSVLCGSAPGSQQHQPPAAWVGGWEQREGMLVETPKLKHQALNWDPLSFSPCRFHLSLPLFAECGRGSWKGNAFGNTQMGSTSIPLSEFRSPPQVPCLPRPAPCPHP